jgi:leader peptidase (prepilin peptidase)/N-methyltransferase
MPVQPIIQILGCATASGALAVPMRHVARRLAAGPDKASVTPLGHAPASALNPPRGITIAACASGGAALAAWLPATDAADAATLVAWLVFLQAGILLATIDLMVRRLPTRLITATAAVCLTLITAGDLISHRPKHLPAAILAAAGLGGVYLLVALAAPGQVGLGDVRLAALAGLLLGTRGPSAAVLGAGLPYLLALPFALSRLRNGGNDRHLPFGPFLVTGALLAALAPAGP